MMKKILNTKIYGLNPILKGNFGVASTRRNKSIFLFCFIWFVLYGKLKTLQAKWNRK